MPFRRLALAGLLIGSIPAMSLAQSAGENSSGLLLELNTAQDVGGACRLTFLADNGTGTDIDHAVFETVIFDPAGSVVSLSLFDFRDLPADRPRVRQFDLPGTECGSVGKALINGANTCVVGGVDSPVCQESLTLRSRLAVELIG